MVAALAFANSQRLKMEEVRCQVEFAKTGVPAGTFTFSSLTPGAQQAYASLQQAMGSDPGVEGAARAAQSVAQRYGADGVAAVNYGRGKNCFRSLRETSGKAQDIFGGININTYATGMGLAAGLGASGKAAGIGAAALGKENPYGLGLAFTSGVLSVASNSATASIRAAQTKLNQTQCFNKRLLHWQSPWVP